MAKTRTVALELKNLPRLDWFRGKWCDPYVEITCKKECGEIVTLAKTEVKKNTNEATFDNIELEVHPNAIYSFKCMDEDEFELNDDEIGIAEFTTEELFADGVTKKTFEDQCVLNVHKETNNLILQISITDIVSHDLSGQNDVFFRCVQNGNVIKESEVIVGNYLSFKPFEVTVVDLNEKDLIITAYDKDFIGKDEIGHYSVDVSTLIGRGVVRGVLRPLKHCEGDESSLRSKIFGSSVKSKSVNEIQEEEIARKEGENQGNIIIKLAADLLDYQGATEKKDEAKAFTDSELFAEADVLFTHDCTINRGGYYGNIYMGHDGFKALLPGNKERKLIVTDTALFCQERDTEDSEDKSIKDIIIVDGNFDFEQHHLNKDHITVKNLDRKVEIRLESNTDHAETDKLIAILEYLKKNKPKSPSEKFENDEIMASIKTFGEPEEESKCRWFIQGRDYMWYLSHILEQAEHEIYITDWWFSPEIVLRRPKTKFADKDWTLEEVLKEKAKNGVMVYIMLFGSVGANMLNLGADRVRDMFNHVPNFQVIVHGAGLGDLFLWSHHEKLCIVDQSISFVGGADLCAGRWDDELYRLMDLQITDMDGDGDIDWDDVKATYENIYGKEKGETIAAAMKEEMWSNDMGGQL